MFKTCDYQVNSTISRKVQIYDTVDDNTRRLQRAAEAFVRKTMRGKQDRLVDEVCGRLNVWRLKLSVELIVIRI
jgi:hypothetical protein